jgi:short-subunit dehydrogenase
MQLNGKKVLITGAAGGIGQHLASLIAQQGATVTLLDRDAKALAILVKFIENQGGNAYPMVCDLAQPELVNQVVQQAVQLMGGLDILINNAGVLDFTEFEAQAADRISFTMQVNCIAPMQLIRQAIPLFKAQHRGAIVNIGSVLGTIALPHHATYSASKFAMRGLSEALRRELVDYPIEVVYVAPRTTGTALNSAEAIALMQAQGNKIDSPLLVAETIVRAIVAGRKETIIGQQEGFFSKINALFPRLVDKALVKQTLAARKLFSKGN